jgi:hypothetical protein
MSIIKDIAVMDVIYERFVEVSNGMINRNGIVYFNGGVDCVADGSWSEIIVGDGSGTSLPPIRDRGFKLRDEF